MRQILNVNRATDNNLLFESLKFMNVKQQIILRTLLFIFKIANGLVPSYLSDRISYKNNYTNATKTCSQNALFYKGIQLYNAIPNEIKEVNSLNKFANLMKKYVIEKY